jgi:hypothetical protein
MSQEAKTFDRKMQNIVVKGSSCEQISRLENELDDSHKTKLGKIIDEWNDRFSTLWTCK